MFTVSLFRKYFNIRRMVPSINADHGSMFDMEFDNPTCRYTPCTTDI